MSYHPHHIRGLSHARAPERMHVQPTSVYRPAPSVYLLGHKMPLLISLKYVSVRCQVTLPLLPLYKLFSGPGNNSVVGNIGKKAWATLWANPSYHHEQRFSFDPGLQFTTHSDLNRRTESGLHRLRLGVAYSSSLTASVGAIPPTAKYVNRRLWHPHIISS